MPPTRVYAACYKPLSLQFARVLELHAGELSDPLVGTLVAQPIDGEPYEAISYVWGGLPTETMVVDGANVAITANLKTALKALRPRPRSSTEGHVPGAGRRRRLWVDSVCINQDDMSERISQVGLMGRIFAGASRVLAWLGHDEEGLTSFAMAVIRDILEDPEVALHEARILLHLDDLTDNDRLDEEDRKRSRTEAQRWAAIKAFFDIEYFHRTWIVQELGLARVADIFCSNKRHAAAALKDTHELELHSINWYRVREFVSYVAYNGASLETHLDLKCWVAAHIRYVWEVDEDGTPQCDFLTALHWVRIMRVTDPRDRVFALLGHPLAVMNGEMVAKPDYNVNRGVVYTKLAATFIRETKNLHVLTLVDHESDQSMRHVQWDTSDDARMPSWVPDWHSINRTAPLPYPIAPAAKEDAEIRIVGSLDSVTGQPMPRLLVRGWVVDQVVAVSHMMETTDFPVTNLLRERTKKNPFFLDRLWEMVYPAQGSNHKDPIKVLDNLSLALADGLRDHAGGLNLAEGGDHSSKDATQPGEAQDMHRQSFAAYLLEYHRLRETGRATTATLSPSEAGSELITAASVSDDDNNLPQRSLYASLPESAQVEIQRRATGATSLIFVQDITWVSMCRVIFRTTTGLIGMGPRVMKPGDVVCRVRGCPVLMVLREAPHEAESDAPRVLRCMHVGPSIVPERMVLGVLDGGEFDEMERELIIC
ncbi:uncharacterized protein BDZ99DRAFT_437051 [Mytilinidion resinicola]|uniref:Heterokaryon incompatibility domain-containing protein n=1 Tax=Mytilinidion resinicola TaxID=574789 RepID=A0A6A6Z210_9PEZI|nr:uncharacterized protein BDZ99DRAFT_437051 [Mytilinidion resinicola]KAF2814225.1 hypothetical protein BDZ99DRAFT_437051 [Mytilinidion resinicola]